jgi:hypothetical protein
MAHRVAGYRMAIDLVIAGCWVVAGAWFYHPISPWFGDGFEKFPLGETAIFETLCPVSRIWPLDRLVAAAAKRKDSPAYPPHKAGFEAAFSHIAQLTFAPSGHNAPINRGGRRRRFGGLFLFRHRFFAF